MTHDELVRFAAGKVGAKIVYDQAEGLGWLYEVEPGRWKRFALAVYAMEQEKQNR